MCWRASWPSKVSDKRYEATMQVRLSACKVSNESRPPMHGETQVAETEMATAPLKSGMSEKNCNECKKICKLANLVHKQALCKQLLYFTQICNSTGRFGLCLSSIRSKAWTSIS